MLMLREFARLLVFVAAGTTTFGQLAVADEPRSPVKNVRTYFFGNSTIFHGNNTPETVVPYWIHEFAKVGGNRFAFTGQFGFMQHHAEQPTTAQWGVQGVRGAWDSDVRKFGAANFDSIVITTANFIQAYPPTEPFYDAPASLVDLTLRVIDDKHEKEPDAEFFIYQNWPEMTGEIAGNAFPPNQDNFNRYHAYTLGQFDDWFETYHQELKKARPDVTIRMLPVGRIMARLFTETDLSALTAADLYTDSAPHGTGTLYFLASIVTYTGLYGQTPVAEFPVPDNIHPLVREKYPEILKLVAEWM